MTDPRVTIVDRWLANLENGPANWAREYETRGLLRELDAHMTSPETVERVAAAIFGSKYISLTYEQLQDEKKDDFRRYAGAAIAAMVGGKP